MKTMCRCAFEYGYYHNRRVGGVRDTCRRRRHSDRRQLRHLAPAAHQRGLSRRRRTDHRKAGKSDDLGRRGVSQSVPAHRRGRMPTAAPAVGGGQTECPANRSGTEDRWPVTCTWLPIYDVSSGFKPSRMPTVTPVSCRQTVASARRCDTEDGRSDAVLRLDSLRRVAAGFRRSAMERPSVVRSRPRGPADPAVAPFLALETVRRFAVVLLPACLGGGGGGAFEVRRQLAELVSSGVPRRQPRRSSSAVLLQRSSRQSARRLPNPVELVIHHPVHALPEVESLEVPNVPIRYREDPPFRKRPRGKWMGKTVINDYQL